MKDLSVNYSKKGQLKIQQMAFILIAVAILFAMALLFYFSVGIAGLKGSAESLREQEVKETIRKISGTPEFAWTVAGDCESCLDMDKVLVLKDRTSYNGFWKNIALLQIMRVYPSYGEKIECTKENYPNCDTITIIDERKNLRGYSVFVALCRFEPEKSYNRCDLGKVIMAFETVE